MKLTANQVWRMAAFFTVVMSFSFIDQIKLNLEWTKWSLIMYCMMVANFLLWTLYGLMVGTKQIRITNGLGLIFSILLIITYFL
jgi:hypothetical protein